MTSLLYGGSVATLVGLFSTVSGVKWSFPEAAIFVVVCIILWEQTEQRRKK